jgi:glutamate---cysteine ligase / carboxylate-amine ligase
MTAALPDWAAWSADHGRPAWTVGIEEEVMLLDPGTWALAYRLDELLPALSPDLAKSVSAETHACTLELAGGVHSSVCAAAAELRSLRAALAGDLAGLGVRPAVAGTHPFAQGENVQVSESARYQVLYEELRELARREPTFALHVHVGVPDPELAMLAADRIRAHLPLILAVSANSPYWGGRDSGMASFRTPLFQAFPRAGIPRPFGSYRAYTDAVDVMLRADAFPEPTFIWWDVRLQPRFGTVEVRVADAQTWVAEAAGIAALIQALVRLEATEGYAPAQLVGAQEVIEENRFLAARDGIDARLIDVKTGERVPARDQLDELLAACEPHVDDLGSRAELDLLRALAASPGAARQREKARESGERGLVESLADAFLDEGPAGGTPSVAAEGKGIV